MQRKHMILAGITAVALLALTAGASAYIATNMNKEEPVAAKVASAPKAKVGENIRWNNNAQPAPAPQQQQVASNCSDGNIVGTVIGGAAGGLAGSQVGKGNGKTAATIGGAVAGGYLGNQFIPTDNALCP